MATAINEEIYLDKRKIQLKNLATEESVKNLKPVILYDNPDGTDTSFELIDAWTNYEYIEIFYTRLEYEIASTKAPTDLVKNSVLPIQAVCCYFGYGSGFWTGWKKYNFSASEPKKVTCNYGNGFVTYNNGSFQTGTENTIKMLRVVGYK